MADATQAPARAEGPTSHTPNQAATPVHQLMNLVMRDVRNVGKDGRNTSQNYSFRGVDDVIGALAQPMRDHGVFMTPEVLDFQSEVRGKMNAVRMRVAFHFYGPAGDSVRAVTLGEASDVADKASNKAMSAALKYALVHTFMIPVDAGSLDDGDRDHPEGQRSPADAFVERLRKPHVWHNPDALRALHAEAKIEGLLGAMVAGPDGLVPLGELIVSRGNQLTAEAEERAARQAQEAPAAAAQVAAEYGVAASPAQQNSGRSASAPADTALEELKVKVANGWTNLDSTRQNLLEAKAKGLADKVVPSGEEMVRLGDLLKNRITELEAARGGERSAA